MNPTMNRNTSLQFGGTLALNLANCTESRLCDRTVALRSV